MQPKWLLFCLLSACSVWVKWLSLAETNVDAFVITTTKAYQNAAPRGSTSDYRIDAFKIMTGGPWDVYSTWKCGIRCHKNFNCSSILIHPGTYTCILTSLNRCQIPTNLMYKSVGYFFYETKQGSEANDSRTCFDQCVEQFGCSGCGRPNCFGSDCSVCVPYCWSIPYPPNGGQILWKDGVTAYIAHCSRTFQFLSHSVDNALDTPDLPLELEVRIHRNGSVIISLFDSVLVRNKLLSVGNYVNGSAGNWWQAPFENRALVTFLNSTCNAFYYPPMQEECNANGLPSSNTNITKGYAWFTGNAIDDAKIINLIQFWIRKKDN